MTTERPSTRLTSGALVDLLAHDIREGRFHPRERLVEVDLAAAYGVSRNAVRSALIELAALGLVEREVNRGARVRPISIDEAIENTEVRFTLQAMCTRLAAERADDETREALATQLASLQAAVAAADIVAGTAANAEISAIIRRASGHATATRIIETLQGQVRLNAYPYLLPDRRVDSMHEYEQIVAAVIAGDADAAAAAAEIHREHVLDALRGIRDSLAGGAVLA